MSTEFIDTNILVYAHSAQPSAHHAVAAELVTRLAREKTGAVSIQVLAEFYSVMTGKLKLDPGEVRPKIEVMAYWTIHQPSHADIVRSIHLQQRHKLHLWDAMILNSALELGAVTLWSEDFQHGKKIGDLRIRNPFYSID